eukprot:Opistho-1_new@52486
MFYYLSLSHEVLLAPKYFGPQLRDILRQKLYAEVEGTCKGEHGWIVMVKSIEDFGRGKIHPNRGIVSFTIRFTAVVFRPFKTEVADAIIEEVNKVGVFAQLGPISMYISHKQLPDKMVFDPTAVPPCYKHLEDNTIIRKGTPVKVRIVGTRVDSTEIVAVGSMKGDRYLGVNATM